MTGSNQNSFFQGVAKIATGSLETEEIQALVQRSSKGAFNHYGSILMFSRYLSRFDDELVKAKSDRRPGRPSSTREDVLKQSMLNEDREYSAGFWIPDLQDQQTLNLLRSWNGEWTSLSSLKYIRLTRNGLTRQSSFPPKGQS